MAKIVLITGHHLCHNPRAVKEADTLAAAGHEVEVLGAWLEDEMAERDRRLLATRSWKYTAVADIRPTATDQLKRWMIRLRMRLAREAWARLGVASRQLLGYAVDPLLAAARQSQADLYIAHSEQALWVVRELARDGARIGVDLEDWYSEDLPAQNRVYRPLSLLRDLERFALRDAAYCCCTSRAMADALALAYDCRSPQVVYNTFPWSDRDALDRQSIDRSDDARVSLHWFSWSLGLSRGLVELFAALRQVKTPLDVHLRARPLAGAETWLSEAAASIAPHRLTIHPLVDNDQLLSRIAEHDIGFAGEPCEIPNANLTVSNKILQYLLAGVAVIASDTQGQREVFDQAPGIGQMYRSGDSQSLAHAIEQLAGNPAALAASRQAALAAAHAKFSWEHDAARLLACVNRALGTECAEGDGRRAGKLQTAAEGGAGPRS